MDVKSQHWDTNLAGYLGYKYGIQDMQNPANGASYIKYCINTYVIIFHHVDHPVTTLNCHLEYSVNGIKMELMPISFK